MSPLLGAVIAAAAAILGGTTGAAVISAVSRRRLTRSEATHQDAITVGQWITNARDQATQIGQQQQQIRELFARIEKLEERERHQLARVAAHTVWDEAILRLIGEHGVTLPADLLPPPPPIAPTEEQP